MLLTARAFLSRAASEMSRSFALFRGTLILVLSVVCTVPAWSRDTVTVLLLATKDKGADATVPLLRVDPSQKPRGRTAVEQIVASITFDVGLHSQHRSLNPPNGALPAGLLAARLGGPQAVLAVAVVIAALLIVLLMEVKRRRPGPTPINDNREHLAVSRHDADLGPEGWETVHDTSSRNIAETKAEQKLHQPGRKTRVDILGELSGALAQELKRPLTAIRTNAEAAEVMLSRQPVDIDEMRDFLHDIITDDIRAYEIVEGLKALLMKGDSRKDLVDINVVVTQGLATVSSELTAKRIVVSKQLASGLPPVRGDRTQLQQAILNLIMNAAEALAEVQDDVASLRVVTRLASDAAVHIAIIDNGPGIDPDLRRLVFRPFYSATRDSLGIGVSVSKLIVTTHGGQLRAFNNTGRGATFEVTLPAVQQEAS